MTLRYQQEYYEQEHFWGNEPSPDNLARINEIISLIPNCVNSVLDVGCGDGCIINRLHNAGYESYGIDISSKALSYVKCWKKQMSCNNLHFKDNSFDLIISSEIIEHLEDTVFMETLEEMERVTKTEIHNPALRFTSTWRRLRMVMMTNVDINETTIATVENRATVRA